MKKVILNFKNMETTEQVHDHLAKQLNFPDYYGRNLDALHDLLTEMTEDICIAIFTPDELEKKCELDRYLYKVKFVLRDAEEENKHLCVIFGSVEENEE